MIDKQLFKLAGAKSILRKLAILEVLQAFFIIGQALALSGVLTKLWEKQGLNITLLIAFICCFIFRQLITLVSDAILDKYSSQSVSQLRNKLLEKVFKQGQTLVQKQGTDSLITMSLDGLGEVKEYMKLIYSKVLAMMIVPVFTLITMFCLNWVSGLILLLMYPLIVLFMIILGHAAQEKAISQFGNFQVLSNNFIDSLRGIDTLKYLGLSKRYSSSIFKLSEVFRKKTMAVLKVAMLSTFALDFFTTISIAIIAVFLGFDLMNGKISLFPALGILILAPEYFLPIRNFAGDFHATLNGKNTFQRFRTLIDSPARPKSNISLNPWNENSKLKIQDLCFDYSEGSEVGPISLDIKGFQKIGVIGMSGSGKSTLINLISGFLTPNSGQITLEGKNCQNLNIQDWQNQIIYIPQQPYIFTKTLRENIAFYNPQASDKEVEKAIHIMGLDELLSELPEGLDTMIGQGKRALSGGQAQRIALARAFLDKNRKIMLFDESTAHLDIETEIDLKKRMLPLMENKLVIFATHRLHWMKEMDHILVLNQGQLVEQGSFADLEKKNGYFNQLSEQMQGDKIVG